MNRLLILPLAVCADEGIRFSNFKNIRRSCPSRATLLTGRWSYKRIQSSLGSKESG